MQAVQLDRHGGPEVLELVSVDRPTPGPDEVLVEIAATGLNPVDTKFRRGFYDPVSLPFTPGVECAGRAVEVGDRVESVAVDDRVIGTGIGSTGHQGAYAEYAVLPEDLVVTLPDGIDDEVAAGASVAGVTSYRALIDHGNLTAGETCLIHGGSGGVGHAGVQIAALTGAKVIATASEGYASRLKELGADAVVPYDHPDLASAIHDIAPEGIDVIVDHRLQDYHSLDIELANMYGRIVGIGEQETEITIADINAARKDELHCIYMSMFNAPNLRALLRRVVTLLAREDLTIEIDRVYALDDARRAQQEMMDESFLGKRLILPA